MDTSLNPCLCRDFVWIFDGIVFRFGFFLFVG